MFNENSFGYNLNGNYAEQRSKRQRAGCAKCSDGVHLVNVRMYH